jgi:hypothetical protein
MDGVRAVWMSVFLLLATAWPAGCAARRAGAPLPPRVEVGSESYEVAFDAVKDELRRLGFRLARVDARAGVITTEPLDSAGFATPWMQVESSSRQEVEGYLHRQRRRVEATFTTTPESDDIRLADGTLALRIRVLEDRVYRHGVQLHPTSVRLVNVARDPALEAIGAQPSFAAPLGEDDRLARRIADRLRGRLEGAADAEGGAVGAERIEALEGA